MPRIVLKLDEQVLKEIPLDKPRLTIGRKLVNDLVIDDPAVSGHHVLIFSQDGAFFIEDLGSTNGTFVNDGKIQKGKLNNSDRVAVGQHVLIYKDEVPAPPSPPKASEPDKPKIVEPAKQKEPVKAVQGTRTAAAEAGMT